MDKKLIVYIMSVGLAFYGGMKLTQLKRLHTFKVGKFVVEFQDNRCGFKTPTIIKPLVKPIPTIKELPKTDIEKVLEPEKVKAVEPTLSEYDSYEEFQKIGKCFEELDEIDSDKLQWDHMKKFKECKLKQLVTNNCNYIEDIAELEVCSKEQETTTQILARDYDNKLDEENGNIGFYESIKGKVKEAIEETSDGNN